MAPLSSWSRSWNDLPYIRHTYLLPYGSGTAPAGMIVIVGRLGFPDWYVEVEQDSGDYHPWPLCIAVLHGT